jgi:hypothetical protein
MTKEIRRLIAITDAAVGPVVSRKWWLEAQAELPRRALAEHEDYPRCDVRSARARLAIRCALLGGSGSTDDVT